MLIKWGSRLIITVILVLGIALYTAPSKIIQNKINESNIGVSISTSSGRLSRGTFHRIKINGQNINQLNWDFSFVKLLLGKLDASIEIIDPKVEGSLHLTQHFTGGTDVSEINLEQSAVALSTMHPALTFVSPDGEILWNDVNFSFDDKKFNDASGKITWSNASLNLNQKFLELGEIQLRPTIDSEDLVLRISSDAILDVKGTMRIRMDKTYLLEFSIQSNLPRAIKQSVMLVSRAGNDARFHFKIPGGW